MSPVGIGVQLAHSFAYFEFGLDGVTLAHEKTGQPADSPKDLKDFEMDEDTLLTDKSQHYYLRTTVKIWLEVYEQKKWKSEQRAISLGETTAEKLVELMGKEWVELSARATQEHTEKELAYVEVWGKKQEQSELIGDLLRRRRSLGKASNV